MGNSGGKKSKFEKLWPNLSKWWTHSSIKWYFRNVYRLGTVQGHNIQWWTKQTWTLGFLKLTALKENTNVNQITTQVNISFQTTKSALIEKYAGMTERSETTSFQKWLQAETWRPRKLNYGKELWTTMLGLENESERLWCFENKGIREFVLPDLRNTLIA